MAELVGVAHDAHGLDAAVDDIHGEHAPDLEHPRLIGRGSTRPAGGVAGLLHERGELLRVDVAALQEGQRLLGGAVVVARGRGGAPARRPTPRTDRGAWLSSISPPRVFFIVLPRRGARLR